MEFVIRMVFGVIFSFISTTFVWLFLGLTSVAALHLGYWDCWWITLAGEQIVILGYNVSAFEI